MRGKALFFISFLLSQSACETEVRSTSACGDGFLDPGEVCDGDQFAAASCAEFGYYQGTPSCTADCTLTGCSGTCGDGVLHLMAQEECDGAELNGATCGNLGLGTGNLACDGFCRLDTTGCSCGNGTLDAGEDCDGLQLGGATCISLGFSGGVLSCGTDCRFLTTSCSTQCGNGALEAGEQCDDGGLQPGDGCSNLCQLESGWTCEGMPSACTEVCGDGLLVGGEVCDGADLGGRSCEDFNYYGGQLQCTLSCTLTAAGCVGTCGDGLLHAAEGELCDGADFGGRTCQTEGFYRGTLACAPQCDALQTHQCDGVCGDGTRDEDGAETCDGADLGGADCTVAGFYQGTLACLPACVGYDTTGCSQRCGDGILQAAHEQCDGADLGGATCATLHHPGGTPGCTSGCTWDTAACLRWTQVAPGSDHACALRSDGAVFCWGDNGSGELGDGFTVQRNAPTAALYLGTGIVEVAVGRNHSCARTAAGQVLCWGANASGQLGVGDTLSHTTATAIPGRTFATIAAGPLADHTCGITPAGALSCWGSNSHGQLGIDSGDPLRHTPAAVTGASAGVTQVSLGGSHTCMIMSGAVWCWGRNDGGQLGIGSTGGAPAYSPVATSLSSGHVQVAAGENHTCARSSAGAASCWGDNSGYQLGDGTATLRATPVAVSGLGSGTAWIAAGTYHSCARKTDGTVACWGWNNRGQMGSGTCYGTQTTPVAVPGLTATAALAAGGFFNCTPVTGGTLRCWGDNGYGQLGRGTAGASCAGTPDTVQGF